MPDKDFNVITRKLSETKWYAEAQFNKIRKTTHTMNEKLRKQRAIMKILYGSLKNSLKSYK